MCVGLWDWQVIGINRNLLKPQLLVLNSTEVVRMKNWGQNKKAEVEDWCFVFLLPGKGGRKKIEGKWLALFFSSLSYHSSISLFLFFLSSTHPSSPLLPLRSAGRFWFLVKELVELESGHASLFFPVLFPCPSHLLQLSCPAKQGSLCNGSKCIKYVLGTTPTSTMLSLTILCGLCKYWPTDFWGNIFFVDIVDVYLKYCWKTFTLFSVSALWSPIHF